MPLVDVHTRTLAHPAAGNNDAIDGEEKAARYGVRSTAALKLPSM